MYGVEEYYNDLINEAKSPEEIKRILVNKFVTGRGVPEEILDRVLEVDPTKKKTYTSWVLNLWQTERPLIVECIENGKLRLLFHYFKTRNNEGLNLCGVATLREALDMLPEIDTTLEKMSNGGPEDNFDIVYDSPEWKIAVPHSYEASEKLGKGCKWCTAGWWEGRGPYYWNQYTQYGPLWINFDYSTPQEDKLHKQHQFTRYQFLFEYNNYYGEFMDIEDQRKMPKDIPTMPEAVKEFYVSQNPRYQNALYGGDARRQRQETTRANYLQERLNDGHVVKQLRNGIKLIVLQEINRNGNGMINNGRYFLYSSEDTNDPISQTEYEHNANVVVDVMPSFPAVVLTAKDGSRKIIVKSSGGWTEYSYEDSFVNEGNGYCYIRTSKGGATGNSYAISDTSSFVSVGGSMNCLGKPRKILNMFRNDETLEAFSGYGTLEIAMEGNIHMLYVYDNNGFSLKAFDYVIDGDKFKVIDGKVRGKYGFYNEQTRYKLYELIDERYAIVRIFDEYNIIDSQSGHLVFNERFKSLENLKKNGLLFAKLQTLEFALVSINTKSIEVIKDMQTIHERYSVNYKGTILDNVEIQIPLSFSGIIFNPADMQAKRRLDAFIGEGANTIRESFSEFYKRMLKQ